MENSIPTVSIIIPVYNGEQYIVECLRSVQAQTLKNWEAVIIHHDSSDNCFEKIKEIVGDDGRFHVFDLTGITLSEARNMGLSEARGKYVGFVDADDWIDPSMYERLFDALEESQADFATCGYFMDYPTHIDNMALFGGKETISVSEVGIENIYLRYIAGNPNVWNKLYRRSFLKESGLCFQVNQGEDILFNLRMLLNLKSLSLVSDLLYHYRQRAGSLIHKNVNEYANGTPSMLEVFLKTNHLDCNQLLTCFAFANVFTGMMFLPDCMCQSYKFFKQQIEVMRKYAFFEKFCKKISKTHEMELLYKEKTMSVRFYWVEKVIFSLCYMNCDYIAAAGMWLSGKLIYLKRNHAHIELFE